MRQGATAVPLLSARAVPLSLDRFVHVPMCGQPHVPHLPTRWQMYPSTSLKRARSLSTRSFAGIRRWTWRSTPPTHRVCHPFRGSSEDRATRKWLLEKSKNKYHSCGPHQGGRSPVRCTVVQDCGGSKGGGGLYSQGTFGVRARPMAVLDPAACQVRRRDRRREWNGASVCLSKAKTKTSQTWKTGRTIVYILGTSLSWHFGQGLDVLHFGY